MKILLLLFGLLSLSIAQMPQTSLWPLPKQVTLGGNEILLAPYFAIAATAHSKSSAALTHGMTSYGELIQLNDGSGAPWPAAAPLLTRLNVTVQQNVALTTQVDESYSLIIPVNGDDASLVAKTQFGALRGLETFSQLTRSDGRRIAARGATIHDAPRFYFRGFLMDTSRHFLSLKVIKQHIDALAYSKFNVLHWHIVDSQSFPFVSMTYPDLSAKGAYSPAHTYSPADVTEVIDYAALRGILVMPEFDTPGHTRSWGDGYPYLLTQCYANGQPNGQVGPLNPVVNTTYTFIANLYKEIAARFPSDIIHMGGDEVSFDCWASNPNVMAFMKARGWSSFVQLETYYVDHVLDQLKTLGRTPLCWEEVFDNGAKITPQTVVGVWKGDYNNTLAKVTAAGYRAVLSSPWYLNYISYGADWIKYYEVEPTNFTGSAAQKSLVIGGSACMWGEFVDNTNAISRTWPRACAIGERLWSPEHVRDVQDAEARLHGHRCRLLTRGIAAEPPNGASFCPLVFEGK